MFSATDILFLLLFSHVTKNRTRIETKLMQKSLWFDGYKQAMAMEKRIKEAGLLGDACATNAFMRKCFECCEINQVCFHPFKVLLLSTGTSTASICQVICWCEHIYSVCVFSFLPLSNIKRSLCLVLFSSLLSITHLVKTLSSLILFLGVGSRFLFSCLFVSSHFSYLYT